MGKLATHVERKRETESLFYEKLHMELFGKKPCGRYNLNEKSASIEQINPVVLGDHVLLKFGCHLKTI